MSLVCDAVVPLVANAAVEDRAVSRPCETAHRVMPALSGPSRCDVSGGS